MSEADKIRRLEAEVADLLHVPHLRGKQIGGTHYKDMVIQPIEFILENNLGFVEGNVIKYIVRWHRKGGIEDLRKAIHYIELLIAHELRQAPAEGPAPR